MCMKIRNNRKTALLERIRVLIKRFWGELSKNIGLYYIQNIGKVNDWDPVIMRHLDDSRKV